MYFLADKNAWNKKISINLLSFMHNYLCCQETPSKTDTVAHHELSWYTEVLFSLPA